jgi:hypothetical protein
VVMVDAVHMASVRNSWGAMGRLTTRKHNIVRINIYLPRQYRIHSVPTPHSPLFPILATTGMSPNVSLILSAIFVLL